MSGETEVMVPFTIVPGYCWNSCHCGIEWKPFRDRPPARATPDGTRPKAEYPSPSVDLTKEETGAKVCLLTILEFDRDSLILAFHKKPARSR